MFEPTLSADCGQCAALCCAHHAFDRSEDFAIDKPAGVPCPNLNSLGRCKIHASLEANGFSGCASYDCLGAGQHVVQGLFGGRSWQDEPELKWPMFEAFRIMRKVHEMLSLLDTTRVLPLSEASKARRAELERALKPANGWTEDVLRAFEAGPVPGQVQTFLASLRGELPQPEALKRTA